METLVNSTPSDGATPYSYSVDVTYENAKQVLVDESMLRPVLIDFWAEWCGPCKSLAPVLEKIANNYKGAFLLAKVNADELPQITSQLGIQSLPTLMLMFNGQPVDGLQGAQSEAAITALLDKYVPAPWVADVQAGLALIESGEDVAKGFALLRSAHKDSGFDPRAAFVYAGALIDNRRLDEARALLATIKMANQNNDYQQLMAQLELAQNAAKAPEITALETQLQADPSNLSVIADLAAQYAQHQHYKEALELLWGVLKKDLAAKDGEIKRLYMDVIATTGKGDPLAISYQQKLYSILY
ncbi:MAG: thioredoxin [Marinagarivorans sp.]|nr:thioredoxin [Marinagarivorans sp.]